MIPDVMERAMTRFVLAAFAVMLAAPAFAEPATTPSDAQAQPDAQSHASYPTGEGNPYLITCRPPQTLPGSRLLGPEVCKTNAVWAQYRKDGMDVVKMTEEFFPRITEFHLKDTFPQYRGNKAGPTPEMHKQKSVYASVGQGGGVDFPGVFAVMRKRHFKGWAVFDIDAPRPGDGTGSVDDNIAASVRYMRDVLKVNLPAPPAKGLFTEA